MVDRGLLEAVEPEQFELFRTFRRSERPADLRLGEDGSLAGAERAGCNPALARRVFDSDLGTIDLIPGRGMIRCVCTGNGRFGRLSGTNYTTSCRDGSGFIHTTGSSATFVGVLSARVRELRIVDASEQVTIVAVNGDDAYWIAVENPVAIITARTDGTATRRTLAGRDATPTRDLAVILERLADATTMVLKVAQDEARGLGWPCVGSEHLLLALLDESAGAAARALRAVGIDQQRARAELLNHVHIGDSPSPEGELPFTPRAIETLDAGYSEAERRGSEEIEPVDLLRGLASEGEGLGSRIIGELGVTDAQLIDSLENQTT